MAALGCESVEELLEAVQAVTGSEQSLLHRAVLSGNAQMVSLLLDLEDHGYAASESLLLFSLIRAV